MESQGKMGYTEHCTLYKEILQPTDICLYLQREMIETFIGNRQRPYTGMGGKRIGNLAFWTCTHYLFEPYQDFVHINRILKC